MPDETLDTTTSDGPITEAALKVVKAVEADLKSLEPATPVVECHPDVWDVNGRLISNDRNNPV